MTKIPFPSLCFLILLFGSDSVVGVQLCREKRVNKFVLFIGKFDDDLGGKYLGDLVCNLI